MLRPRLAPWLATVVWAAVIFGTSCTFISRRVFINFVKRFIPAGVPQELWVSFWRNLGIFVVKGYHVAEFALLCSLIFSVLGRKLDFPRAIAASAMFALLYAISDEWHQTFIRGRGGTWVDVIIDCLGISLATLFLWRRARREQTLAGAFS